MLVPTSLHGGDMLVKAADLVPPSFARDGGVKTRAAIVSVSLCHFLSLNGHLVICVWFGI
ncbi:hypothetical protein Hanom_Chr16g01445881 [Helianthus anomalus]